MSLRTFGRQNTLRNNTSTILAPSPEVRTKISSWATAYQQGLLPCHHRNPFRESGFRLVVPDFHELNMPMGYTHVRALINPRHKFEGGRLTEGFANRRSF